MVCAGTFSTWEGMGVEGLGPLLLVQVADHSSHPAIMGVVSGG